MMYSLLLLAAVAMQVNALERRDIDRNCGDVIKCSQAHPICGSIIRNKLQCVSLKEIHGDYMIELSKSSKGPVTISNVVSLKNFDVRNCVWRKMALKTHKIQLKWSKTLSGELYSATSKMEGT